MKITPYSKNAKKHPDAQLKQIALSLKEYGWRQPIVTDKNNEIIVGHGRWMAYEKYPEGIKEPWIVKADDLTPAQVKGYRLMDNKTNESDWDMALAIEELKELDSLGFDIELTGFDKDLLIEADDADDVIPENAPTRAKLGDVWLLGEHRVMCGDSTDKASVERLMDGKKADMVFTSPPYSDMREYNGHKDLDVTNLLWFIDAFSQSTDFMVVNLGLQRKNGEIVQYWNNYIDAARECGYKLLSWNIWSRKDKGGSVAAMTAMFQIEHEWIFVFGRDKKDIKRTRPNKLAGQKTAGTNRQKDGTTKQIKERKIAYFGKMSSVTDCDFSRGKNEHSATF